MERPLIIPMVLMVLILLGIGITGWCLWNSDTHGQDGPVFQDLYEPIPLVYTPGEIPVQVNETINKTRLDLDDLASLPDSERTVKNTLVRFEEIITSFDDQTLKYTLIGAEFPDPEVAAKARHATYQRDAFLNEVYLRSDLAHALSVVIPDSDTDRELQKRINESFNLSTLPGPVRERLTALGQNLSEAETAYLKNQQEGNASLNLLLIPQIITLRQEIVSLLGYHSFAEYQIAQSGIPFDQTELTNYLINLSIPLSRQSHEEAGSLLRIKQEKDPNASVVYDYEIPILHSRLPESMNQSRSSDVSGLFPAESVIANTNAIFSRIFGISIITALTNQTFDPGMHLFRITTRESSKPQAWFYLWIRPEAGVRSTSGRTYYLRAGHDSGGEWVPPVTVIVLIVPAERNHGQILLTPVDMQVLFHEFGHLFRQSLATSRYATLSSATRDESGYSELFSLFLEKFLWTPEVLDLLSGKTSTGMNRLPEALRDRIIADHGEEAEYGTGYIRVYPVFLSLMDLQIHSGNSSSDFYSLYDRMYENLTGYRSASGISSLLLNPAFFVSDNAGTYWHYVLDDAYAADLFSRFGYEGVLDAREGVLCRRELFEPAGSVDLCILMKNFLGHNPAGIGCVDQKSNKSGFP